MTAGGLAPVTIGASEVAVILGLGRQRSDGEPYTSALELWAHLTGGLPRYDSASSPDAEIGRWMEPAVLHRLASERGWTWGTDIAPGPRLDEPGLVADGVPWHARPDAIAPALPGTVEAKAPRTLDPSRWGPTGTDEMPPEYLVQVLAQVAVGWAKWRTELGVLAAMARAPGWGDSRVWAVYSYRRDPARERRVIDAVAEWVEVHIHGGAPPDPEGSESATRALRRMFAPVDERVHQATPTDLEHYRRLLGCRTAMEEIRGRADEARQRLQLAMADATVLVDSGERLATWRPDKGGGRRFLLPRDTRLPEEDP